jgi:release factor glutamine methyltransferase
MNRAETNGGVWTVARLLKWTREYFTKHSLESPRLCAEILLAHAMGCQRIELYTRYESVPDPDVLQTFRTAIAQAATGQPIAYLTGTKEFFALPFEVTPDVMIPRPETEVLVERTIDLAKRGEPNVHAILDVGTGSGCIAISLAKNLPDASICGSDIDPAAIAVARRNAERLGVRERIEFRTGDLFEPWEPNRRFDAIVGNPPYIAESEAASLPANVRDFEPHAALFAGSDGLDVLRRLIAEAPPHLRSGGHLLTEVAYDQSSAVRGLLDEAGWCDIVTYRDELGHERVVHARCRASAKTPSS